MLDSNRRTITLVHKRNVIFNIILFFISRVDGLMLNSEQTSRDLVPSLGTVGKNSGVFVASSTGAHQHQYSTKTFLELLTSSTSRPLRRYRTLPSHPSVGRRMLQPPSDSIKVRIASTQIPRINLESRKSNLKQAVDIDQSSSQHVNEHRSSQNYSKADENSDTNPWKTERRLTVSNDIKRNESVFLFSPTLNNPMIGEPTSTSFSDDHQYLKEAGKSKVQARNYVLNKEEALTVSHEIQQNDSALLPIPEYTISMIGDAAVTSEHLDFSVVSAYMQENVGRKRQAQKIDTQVMPLDEVIHTMFHNYAYGKSRVDRNHLRLIKDDRERIAHLLGESGWLENTLRLDSVYNSYRDLLALHRMTKDLSLTVSELIRFSTSKIDGLMLPSQGSLRWSQMVLNGDSDRQPVSAILSKLHLMVNGGTPQYTAGRSVLDVYAERIPVSSRQSKAWHVEAFFHNLALLQTLGTACIVSALNRQDKDTVELKLAVKEGLKTRLVEKLKHQLRVQRSRLANLKGRDLDVFKPSAWSRFSSFNLKRKIIVDTGIIGIATKDAKTIKRSRMFKSALILSERRGLKKDRDHQYFDHKPVLPSTDLPNMRNVSVAPISGCQFISKDNILALRCSHKTNYQCHKGKDNHNAASSSDFIFQQEFLPQNYRVGLTEKCTPANLTCVDTRWVTSSDSRKVVCALKLLVDSESGCLSIGAYFCDKNPCSRNQREWSKREQTRHNRRKKKTDSKSKTAWNSWAAHGWKVDSQIVDPHLSGWTRGVRLCERGGRLTLELKTTFY